MQAEVAYKDRNIGSSSPGLLNCQSLASKRSTCHMELQLPPENQHWVGYNLID